MKLKNYWKPTPAKFRKLGDAFLGIAAYAETQQMFTGKSSILLTASIVGIAGKFLTNFFAEENTNTDGDTN